jgi:LytS/YehU family sensor histidine kinase
MAERVAWHSLRRVRFVAIQSAFLLATCGAWQLGFFGFLWFLGGWQNLQWVVSRSLPGSYFFDLLICCLQAAVFHAIRVSREMQEKELAVVEADRLRTRAEMEALRGRLNPHFLFNSLHSITALVRDDPGQAEDALLQFAALLRRVLEVKRGSTDDVALADEMAFVDDYLAIERLRLGDRLRIDRHISPAALGCWLPAFSVQPLVENALRHAIAPRREGGRVSVRAEVSGNQLQVEVGDDGPGANTAAVALSSGIGLDVIRRRLNLRHGANALLEVFTSPGSGFKVRFSLPVETGPLTESP